MMEAHLAGYNGGYNEVVISGTDWNAALPDGVAAFVYGDDEGDARTRHGAFLAHFGKNGCQVPLLSMDLSSGWPFRAVSC